VSRDNTVKYNWRVLPLLPDAQRTSYAGLRVEVLERPDGELIVRYEGHRVATQEPPPRMGAMWAGVTAWSRGLNSGASVKGGEKMYRAGGPIAWFGCRRAAKRS